MLYISWSGSNLNNLILELIAWIILALTTKVGVLYFARHPIRSYKAAWVAVCDTKPSGVVYELYRAGCCWLVLKNNKKQNNNNAYQFAFIFKSTEVKNRKEL
ncbi:MAG: hypothetical protein WC091_00555 [Sulfuricellaceae bacterium]